MGQAARHIRHITSLVDQMVALLRKILVKQQVWNLGHQRHWLTLITAASFLIGKLLFFTLEGGNAKWKSLLQHVAQSTITLQGLINLCRISAVCNNMLTTLIGNPLEIPNLVTTLG